MTLIIGLRQSTGVILAGDSCFTSGDNLLKPIGPKIAKVGHYVIGISGDYAFSQKIFYDFDPPNPLDESENPLDGEDRWLRFFMKKFVPAWKAVAAEFKESSLDKSSEDRFWPRALVACGGHLVELNPDGCVEPVALGDWRCIGSGDAHAEGVMATMELFNKSLLDQKLMKQDLVKTIEIVSRFVASVGGDVQVVDCEAEKYA